MRDKMIEIESLISIIFWFLIIIVGICKIIQKKKDSSIKKVTYELYDLNL